MNILRKLRVLLTLLIGAVLVIPMGVQAATPKDTLVMAWNIDAISTFDPAQIGELVTAEMYSNICDTLVFNDINDESKVMPGIAESWEISADGKVITLHIRQNAKHFPSGNPVTAEDAVWSIKRMLHLNYGASSTLKNYGFNKENMDDAFQLVDQYTMRVTIQNDLPPQLILLSTLAGRTGSVLDKKMLLANEEKNDLGHQYATTKSACVGPYQLRQWNAGEVVVLERNDDYWGGKPPMKRIIIKHISEASAQRLQIEKGDVDVIRDMTPEDITAFLSNPDININQHRRHQLSYMAINNVHPVFKSDKARLATKYLWDYEALTKTVLQNIGVPRSSVVPLGSFGALDEQKGAPFRLDIEKARSLLAEAGHADGFSMTILVGSLPESPTMAQHFQENAAKVGITVKIEQMANAELFSRYRSRNFESLLVEWSSNVPHAHDMLSRHATNPDPRDEAKLTMMPAWRGGWYRPEFNEMIAAAAAERNLKKQVSAYHNIQSRLYEEGPYTYIFQKISNIAIRKEITNFPAHAFRVYYNKITK